MHVWYFFKKSNIFTIIFSSGLCKSNCVKSLSILNFLSLKKKAVFLKKEQKTKNKLYALVWIPLFHQRLGETLTQRRSLTYILHSLKRLAIKGDNVEACFILCSISFYSLGLILDIVSTPQCGVCMFLLTKCIPFLKF